MATIYESAPAYDVGNIAQLMPQSGFVKEFDTSKVDIAHVRDYMIMDATTSYNKSYSGTVTTQPVSSQTEVADHVTINTPEFSIDGVVTRQNALFGYKWRLESIDSTDVDRIRNFIKKVSNCMKVKHLFTVYLPDGLVETNCVITNADFSRGINEHNVMNVSLKLRKINVIQSGVRIVTKINEKEIDKAGEKSKTAQTIEANVVNDAEDRARTPNTQTIVRPESEIFPSITTKQEYLAAILGV